MLVYPRLLHEQLQSWLFMWQEEEHGEKTQKRDFRKLEADNNGIPENHVLSYKNVVPFFIHREF